MAPALSRRTVLRGLGATVALPALDALTRPALAGAEAAAPAAGSSPLRMMFVYIPNGAEMDRWTPEGSGADWQATEILQPLERHRRDLVVLTGLAHRKADPNGDGPGDHARASASFLTGCQARKTASVDIRVGPSVDQVAAAHLVDQTRFASLELGCDKGRQAGACDSGYSCAYQFNLAWKTATLPMPPEVDPRQAFERLFGGGEADEPARAHRLATRRSVLDFVLEDARRLRGRLDARDAGKLDQYLDSVRAVERQIERSERSRAQLPPGTDPLDELPEDYREHIRLMYEMAVLAFQTDSTRIVTLMIAHDGSNRSYPFIDVPEGHHDLSHHGGDEAKRRKIARINRFHTEQFAQFLDRMKEITEQDATLLDRSMIVYGGGISDGNAHAHDNLPVLLAGRGGGTIESGRHLRFASEPPMCNLYVSMLQRIGLAVDRFGDSTGPLTGLGPDPT